MPATAASHCRLTYYRPPWPQTRAPRLATLRCRDGLWVGSNAMQVAGAAPRRAAAYKPAKTQIVTYPRPERQRSILETAEAHAKQSHTISRTVYGHYPSQYRRLSRRVGVQRLKSAIKVPQVAYRSSSVEQHPDASTFDTAGAVWVVESVDSTDATTLTACGLRPCRGRSTSIIRLGRIHHAPRCGEARCQGIGDGRQRAWQSCMSLC